MEQTGDDIERILGKMEWENVVSTLQTAIHGLLAESHDPSSPLTPPPPPSVHAELNHLQPAAHQGGGSDETVPLEVALRLFDAVSPSTATPSTNVCDTQPLEPPSPAGACSQGQAPQLQLYQPPAYNVPAAVSFPAAAPPNPLNLVPAISSPQSISQIPQPVINTEMEQESKQDRDRPYIKKPPNAFMLFLKEQRPLVTGNIKHQGSQAVNKVLGQKWKSLSAEDQAQYYEQAKREQRLHAQLYPNWTYHENYGKKKERKNRKALLKAQAKRQRGAKKPRGKAEPPQLQLVQVLLPSTHTCVLELHHPQPVWVKLPHSLDVVSVLVCDTCHLPRVCEVSVPAGPTAGP